LGALQYLCNHNTIKRQFHKKYIFDRFFCLFATLVVQNLLEHGLKTEKNKEKAKSAFENSRFQYVIHILHQVSPLGFPP
jgi:hypothetical protein